MQRDRRSTAAKKLFGFTDAQLGLTAWLDHVKVRTYRAGGQSQITRLYREGALVGWLAPNDTATDIDNIEMAYLSQPHDHFWIAEVDRGVVGMVGVARAGELVGQIRRLRADPTCQQKQIALAVKLVQTALDHCRQNGYLKVILNTHFDPYLAVHLLRDLGFCYSRTRTLHGKEILEFYVDLYHRSDRET